MTSHFTSASHGPRDGGAIGPSELPDRLDRPGFPDFPDRPGGVGTGPSGPDGVHILIVLVVLPMIDTSASAIPRVTGTAPRLSLGCVCNATSARVPDDTQPARAGRSSDAVPE